MTLRLLALLVATSVAAAQVPPRDANAAFIAAATRGAEKYRSQEAAIADGYRPVGVEFPAMGEHWVSLQRVMADAIDPAHPAVLIYVTVGGKAELSGVGFTDLLHPGDALPSRPAAGVWHEHNGSVAEESFPLQHHMGVSGGKGALRLAILHVWTHAPNPAGPFATDNWTLPARRLGVPAAMLGADATRGVSLAQDATGYYELMLRTALRPTDDEEIVIEAVLDEAMAAARRAGKSEAALAESWEQLWRRLGERLPRHRAELVALKREL